MLARLRATTRRQRALLAAGAAAALAAGYLLLSTQLDTWKERERAAAVRALEAQLSSEADDKQAEAECAARALASLLSPHAPPRSLHSHFDGIQRISDTTTLPSLLTGLRERLRACADVEALTARLQAGALPPSAKLAAWNELAVLSFTRATAAAFCVALLDLLLRVQLNLLGSHMYLAQAAGAQPGGGGYSRPSGCGSGWGSVTAGGEAVGADGSPPRKPQSGSGALSPAAQHAYLSLCAHFVRHGAGAVAAGCEASARAVLDGVPLRAPLTHADAAAMLARIASAFQHGVTGDDVDTLGGGFATATQCGASAPPTPTIVEASSAAELGAAQSAGSFATALNESAGASSNSVAASASQHQSASHPSCPPPSYAAVTGPDVEEEAAPGAAWAELLLPWPAIPRWSTAQPPRPCGVGSGSGGVPPSPSALPDSGGDGCGSGFGSRDAALLSRLVDETRSVLRGARFARLAASAIDAAAAQVAAQLGGAFGGVPMATPVGASSAASPAYSSPQLPLAKLVPAVAAAAEVAWIVPEAGAGHDRNSGGGASRPPRGVAAAVAALPEVDAFCADLFSSV